VPGGKGWTDRLDPELRRAVCYPTMNPGGVHRFRWVGMPYRTERQVLDHSSQWDPAGQRLAMACAVNTASAPSKTVIVSAFFM
jgi:hypothetical protein